MSTLDGRLKAFTRRFCVIAIYQDCLILVFTTHEYQEFDMDVGSPRH